MRMHVTRPYTSYLLMAKKDVYKALTGAQSLKQLDLFFSFKFIRLDQHHRTLLHIVQRKEKLSPSFYNQKKPISITQCEEGTD